MTDASNKLATTQRPLGAHLSIAGGLDQAVIRAQALNATALQIFTRNQVQWNVPPLLPEAVQAFREQLRHSQIQFLCAHASYLINLATPDARQFDRAVAAMIVELQRAEALGCACVIVHPGSPKTASRDFGIARVASALQQVLRATAELTVAVALENTVGSGNTVGGDLVELAAIRDRAGNPQRLGFCLDTAHAYGYGYDLGTETGCQRFCTDVQLCLGRQNVRVMHLNDSSCQVGSHRDRHAHIGDGWIGESGFARLLHAPVLAGIPAIIETPKGDGQGKGDADNLKTLRRLDSDLGDVAR